jgi:hypothetical protein
VNITVGTGSPLAFVLAYAFGVLIFVMLLGALAIGFWWIIAGIRDRMIARTGKSRASYITGTTIIAVLIGLAVWITLSPLK